MTTIVADFETRTLFSDSRATVTRDDISSFYENSQKLHSHYTGKMILATWGSVHLTHMILSHLGFDEEYSSGPVPLSRLSSSVGDSGGVIIFNKYNHTAKVITIQKDRWDKISIEKRWLTKFSHVAAGSGKDIASKVFNATNSHKRAAQMAGFLDKYSNTKIQQLSI